MTRMSVFDGNRLTEKAAALEFYTWLRENNPHLPDPNHVVVSPGISLTVEPGGISTVSFTCYVAVPGAPHEPSLPIHDHDESQ